MRRGLNTRTVAKPVPFTVAPPAAQSRALIRSVTPPTIHPSAASAAAPATAAPATAAPAVNQPVAQPANQPVNQPVSQPVATPVAVQPATPTVPAQITPPAEPRRARARPKAVPVVTPQRSPADATVDSTDALIAECFAEAIDAEQSLPAEPAKRVKAPKPPVVKKSTRGPGRPRKQDISSTANIAGIVQTPLDVTNTLELKHHTPSVFRKLVMSLRLYNVSTVDILFDKSGLRIRTVCSLKKNHIYFDVDGTCVSWYYCAEPIAVCVKLESLVGIMAPVGKNHTQIMFIIKNADRSKLWCIMQESEMGGTIRHQIDTITRRQADIHEFTDDEIDYPIKFRYISAELKKLVANASKLADTIKIQKEGGDTDLIITVVHEGLSVDYHYPAAKIGLICRLEDPDDIVSATVSTRHVKQFTDTIIGDDVIISVDKARNMCFMSATGKRDDRYTFTARVFIKLNA